METLLLTLLVIAIIPVQIFMQKRCKANCNAFILLFVLQIAAVIYLCFKHA